MALIPSSSPSSPPSRLQPYAASSETPRLIVCTEGADSTGKSHFGLSGPKPIAYFVIGDRGFETASDATKTRLGLIDGVDQACYTYDKADAGDDDPKAIARLAAQEAWIPFRTDYTTALTRGRLKRGVRGRPTAEWEPYRGIVVDTGGESWELIRLARFGKLEQIPPILYNSVNAEFRGHIIRAAFKSNCNVVFVHKQKDEYINKINNLGKEVGTKTGKVIRAGFKDMGYEIPTRLTHKRDLVQPIPDRYLIHVDKCALNPELEGMEFGGLSFGDFAQLVYPDVPREYWD